MPSVTLTFPDGPLFDITKLSLLRRHPVPIVLETGLPEIDPDTGLPWTDNNWLISRFEFFLESETKKGFRSLKLDEGEQNFRDEMGQFDGAFVIT